VIHSNLVRSIELKGLLAVVCLNNCFVSSIVANSISERIGSRFGGALTLGGFDEDAVSPPSA